MFIITFIVGSNLWISCFIHEETGGQKWLGAKKALIFCDGVWEWVVALLWEDFAYAIAAFIFYFFLG